MQNKKNRKILFVITFMFFCIMCIENITFAAGSGQKSAADAVTTTIQQGKDSASNFNFNRFDDNGNNDIDSTTKNAMGTAIQVVRVAGTGISIIMLSYMGIKYMMAAPSEKAEFKRSAGIYVLGAILLFAASNILSIIATFTSSNIK